MDWLIIFSWLAIIVGLYNMINSKRTWMNWLGAFLGIGLLVFFAMKFGYSLHACEVEPVSQYTELRVSNMSHFNESR